MTSLKYSKLKRCAICKEPFPVIMVMACQKCCSSTNKYGGKK